MVYSRAALENLKMSELRAIGTPIGASDTSKDELIDEILKKQPKPKGLTDTEKLIRDLQVAKGDVMRTYECRDSILVALQRLKDMEG